MQKFFATLLLLLAVSSSLTSAAHKDRPSTGNLNDYKVTNSYINPEGNQFFAELEYTGSSNTYINATNPVIQKLNFTYAFHTPSELQVRIVDAENERWEVPNEAPFPYADPNQKVLLVQGEASVFVVNELFSFKVVRNATGEVLFDTSIGNFIFSDYYIELSTPITSRYFYGLGERAYNLTLGPDGIYTIWNIDFNQNIENGEGGHGSYGCHPVYLNKEKSGKWFMNLLRNINAMDVIMQNSETITYKITGGILDFNIFLGDERPENVLTSYHQYLGGWTLPPFWSLGYHQSRWGYVNLQNFTDLVNNFTYYDLPIDVIWSDIDYMYEFIDFTIDETRFPPQGMMDLLKNAQKRWVPIIDAGIGPLDSDVYKKGLEYDLYIKDPNGTNLVGIVWPGETSWADWFNPNASKFWSDGLAQLYQLVEYSGIWLDMNEISNLINGEVGFEPNMSDIRNALPYTPGNPLYTDTVRVDSVHYNGWDDFNTHSIFNFMEQNITYNHLKTIGDLPFILTRSNVFGSGKYAAHWTGDNNSSWVFLQLTIPSIMNFNFFGIPMTGSDICGFKANTTEELCSRWMQLGLMQPFSRNHAENDTIRQEPWRFGPTLLETARLSMNLKYSLLKHYYAQFVEKRGLGTVYRPVFMEFPDDEVLLDPQETFINQQFLVGPSLMAAPVVNEGEVTKTVYFPRGRWFDYFTGAVTYDNFNSGGTYPDYPAPLNATLPLFIRGGYVVAGQNTAGVKRSDDLSNMYNLTTGLLINEGKYSAQGTLIGIADMSEGNVYQKCVVSNCLYNVDVTGNQNINNLRTVKWTFNAQDKSAVGNLEAVGLRQLRIYGAFADNETEVKGRGAFEVTRDYQITVYSGLKLIQTTRQTIDDHGPIIVDLNEDVMISDGSNVSVTLTQLSEKRDEGFLEDKHREQV